MSLSRMKGYIVLGAVLKLERGDGEKIKTYMDELKEESETLDDHPKPYGTTENSPDFPAEGKFTPPY